MQRSEWIWICPSASRTLECIHSGTSKIRMAVIDHTLASYALIPLIGRPRDHNHLF